MQNNDMTKIVVTGTRGIPNVMGGIETHCEELYPRMARMGFDVTVVRRPNYVSDRLEEWRGVKLLDIPTPKRKNVETLVHTWKAILQARRLHADVVHIHAIGPALLTPLARLLGMKVVFTHHGADYKREKWGIMAKTALRLGELAGCLFANDIIVISNVIKDFIARKYGRTRNVHLIYNGVSAPELCDYQEYFKELGIESGKYILGMCRFSPEKNLSHLIKAYVLLRQEGRLPEGMRLVIAGDADFPDKGIGDMKKMARRNGVVLPGFVKGRKLHSLLTNATCYCLPSSHEGLPIALLEAMSYGLPVVVSDIPANTEIGLPEEDYFHVGDVDGLADKLASIVSKPLRRIEYDLGKYDWDKIAEQTAEVYKNIMKE